MEVERWQIFVAFDARREAGEVGDEGHPGHGGVNARYDALSDLLGPRRVPPSDARRMHAEWRWLDRDYYIAEGPPYMAEAAQSIHPAPLMSAHEPGSDRTCRANLTGGSEPFTRRAPGVHPSVGTLWR